MDLPLIHKTIPGTGAKQPAVPLSTSMHIKIHSPFKTYFDDEALSISAVNETGPFDILPRHHNFMTLLTPCTIVVRTNRGDEQIPIQRGIMHVKADKVIVFLDV